MPFVNTSTGKVYGCKEGSKVWFHEQGHIQFNDSEFGTRINYYGIFFQMIAVFFIALGLLIDNLYVKAFGFVNALGMICCYIYEEVWCWIFALREFKKVKM